MIVFAWYATPGKLTVMEIEPATLCLQLHDPLLGTVVQGWIKLVIFFKRLKIVHLL